MPRSSAGLVAAGVALAASTASYSARAHAVGLSRGEYALDGRTIVADLRFARADARELDARTLSRGVVVRAGDRDCPGIVEATSESEPDAVDWRMRFSCSVPAGLLTLRLPLLDDLPPGHRQAVRLRAGRVVADDVLYRRHDSLSVPLQDASPTPERRVTRWLRAAAMLRMGLEHILTGYDHLVFLVALVAVGGRARSLLALVTAFTVAHSITLAVAALGLWSAPSRIVEPAIALSIAYVGVENFFVRSAEGRWRVTFPFGLVHGFGFASALRDVAIPRADVPLALLCFNGGVELGQLAVLAALLPLFAALRRSRRLGPVLVPALSAAVIALSAVWFASRIGV